MTKTISLVNICGFFIHKKPPKPRLFIALVTTSSTLCGYAFATGTEIALLL